MNLTRETQPDTTSTLGTKRSSRKEETQGQKDHPEKRKRSHTRDTEAQGQKDRSRKRKEDTLETLK